MEKRLTMVLACLFLSIGMALAQTKVSGVVTSSEDGGPIIGASVKVVGSSTMGTMTNSDGQFSLTIPNGSTHLEISYIGMVSKTVKASANMKIILDPDNQQLDEVIVQAFGTAKKSAFTGSATVIDSKELAKAQVTSVTNALAGTVPGVQLTSSNGAPNATSTIRIRGFSSLNAGNDPLIIVDGAPYSGDLGNLNPNDVESMTVLKDAASNALYGARGANGVIMITTKTAKRNGDAKITFDAKYGWNTMALQHYDVIKNPAQYYEMQYAALKNYYVSQGESETAAWQDANANLCGKTANGGLDYNIWTVPDGQLLIGSNGKMNPNATIGRIASYKGTDYLVTPDDWEDVGTRTGGRQEYNLSVNAGTDRSTFYASLGYLNNEGITYRSDLERMTGRLRADYQAKKWLKVGANLSFAHYKANSLSNNGSSTSTGNIWAFTSQMAPIYPAYIRNADGSIMVDGNGIQVMDYGDGNNAGQARPFIYNANPIQDVKLNTDGYNGNQATANGFMDIEFMPGLKLTLNGTYNLDETRTTFVYNPYYGQFDSTGGTVQKVHGRSYNYNLQQLLNYTTTIAQHNNLTALLGHEYYNSLYYELSASKSQMFSQKNKELYGAVVDGQSAYSYNTRYNNEGYFGRVEYDYDSRYFASASLRRDASSRFAKDHRWGTFWSIGGAWLMNKEAWFNAPWVDQLKLKASIGSQGNDNIGSYRYTDLFDITNSAGAIGISFRSKGTPDITWETNTNFNVGAEFSLFKKLSGSLEYYYRKTTNMLFSFSVAPSLGYANYYDNVGDLYNTGFELTLNYNPIHVKNFDWNVSFNIASLRNRITKLHPDKKTSTAYDASGTPSYGYTSGNYYITEGKSMYTWYMKEYAGVDATTGQSMWYKNTYEQDANKNDIYYDESGNVVESTYSGLKHKKVTGRETTTTYADADYYITNKSTLPTFYGGIGTSVSAYGFDLSINCSFSLGGYQYDGTYAQFMSSPTSSNAGYNFHKDLLKSWTATNPSTTIPRLQWNDLYSGSFSTRFLTRSNYLNIENINFGYTLPASLTRNISIEALRIYLAAENVAYISERKGFDPRQTYDGTTNATNYSPMRTISLGMTVTF
jgi:TonB-linked SusC/RagA family outer membrane protein